MKEKLDIIHTSCTRSSLEKKSDLLISSGLGTRLVYFAVFNKCMGIQLASEKLCSLVVSKVKFVVLP